MEYSNNISPKESSSVPAEDKGDTVSTSIKRRKKMDQEKRQGESNGEQDSSKSVVTVNNGSSRNGTASTSTETTENKKVKRQASVSLLNNDKNKRSRIDKERMAKKIMGRASMTTIRRTRSTHRFSASESIHSDIDFPLTTSTITSVARSGLLGDSNNNSDYDNDDDDIDDEFASSGAAREEQSITTNEGEVPRYALPCGGNNTTTTTSQSLLPSTMKILSPFFLCQHSAGRCTSCGTGIKNIVTDTTGNLSTKNQLSLSLQIPEQSVDIQQPPQLQQHRPTKSVVLHRGGSTLSETSRGTILDTKQRGILEILFQSYYVACTLYHCQPNSGVLTALRYRLPALRVSSPFVDDDMLALSELLLEYSNTYLSHVKRLDFSTVCYEKKINGKRGFKSHGAYALSRVLLQSKYISEIFLQRHKIGSYGASAIFRSCQYNPSIKVLVLRRCAIGEQGAIAFTKCIVSSSCGLREVDLSNCGMGYYGTKQVCDAIVEREHRGLEVLSEIDLEGNLIFQEVMNAVTHGLGIIFAIVGSILLLKRAKSYPLQYSIACGIYSTSIMILFTCSTLYHSFFALKHTRYIFGIFDHCAIYLLIAGSYTAYIGVCFEEKMLQHWCLLGCIWICSLLGVYVEAFHIDWKHKGSFSLCMYLGLGWACLLCLPSLIEALPRQSLIMLVLGGVGYTGGVPFFVRNNNLDHSIWHMFVLSASIFHWIGVYNLL